MLNELLERIKSYELYQVFLDPILTKVGISVIDKTFGRYQLPMLESEQLLHDLNYIQNSKYIALTSTEFKLYTQTWFDNKNFKQPKLELIYIHGYAEYSGRFSRKAKELLKLGYRIHCIDLPGHGRSDGLHGNFPNLSGLSTILKEWISKVKEEYQLLDTNTFLLASSMGATITLNLLTEYNNIGCSGVVLISPAILPREDEKPSELMLTILYFIKSIIPRLPLLPFVPNVTNDDVEFQTEFINDKLTYKGGLRAINLYNAIFEVQDMLSKLDKFTYNILIVQGTNDRAINPKGAELVYDKIGSKDKKFIKVEGGEHELLNDKKCPQVLGMVTKWFNDKL